MEHANDHPETFTPAFIPDGMTNTAADHAEILGGLEQQHQQEFADLFTAAMQSTSSEERLKLLRGFESRLRAVLEPGSSQDVFIDDQSLNDAMTNGKGHIPVGGGSLGQRITFQSYRPLSPDNEQLTVDGKPGWMRYTQPTTKPGMDSTIGTQTWQRYAEYFGTTDGYVQLVADADIRTESF